MKIEVPVLEFKEDGLYLDNKRLSYITNLWISSDAEISPYASEIDIEGIESDPHGKPLADEHGDFKTYHINKYVAIKGLGDQQEEY